MKAYRIWAIAKKEWVHVVRDWRSLILGIFIPAVLLILFGYALKLDVDNVPMAVWDQSKTPQSRELIDLFKASTYFDVNKYIESYPELELAINKSEVSIAMVIPRDFARNMISGKETPVQFIVDGSDSNTATIALGYVDSLAKGVSHKMLVQTLQRSGKSPLPSPIDLKARIWYNPEIESKNNIVPGLIAVIMMVISAVLTSLTIAREWERGTMEQLISTPVKVPELIIGKLLPYFVIGFVDVLIIVLMGQFIFEVPLRGSLILLFFMTFIFLAGSLSLGMLISIAAKQQLVATQMAMVSTFLPSFLLSGFMTTITNMPYAIQLVTFLVPARYFIIILKGIYLKGVGLSVMYIETLFMIAFAIIMVSLAILSFKKKLT